MEKLYGVFITGLLMPFESPLAYVPQAQALPLEGYELRLHDGTYDNAHLSGKRLLIDGHSLGGLKAHELACELGAEILLLRDPVHPNWSHEALIKPPGVKLAICFKQDKPGFTLIPPGMNPPSVALSDERWTQHVDLPHARFIQDATINLWEREAVKKFNEVQL